MVLSSFSASFFFLFLVVDKLWKSFFRIFKRGVGEGGDGTIATIVR